MPCSPPGKPKCDQNCGWLTGAMIEPLSLEGRGDVAAMLDNVFAKSGFNARRLGEAGQIFSRMLNDNATVTLTLAGAMTPIGMSGVIISLIEHGFIDMIISTGANLYHDLHRPYGMPMVQGSPHVDDNELADVGVARIYDAFISDEDTLTATDRVILRAMREFDTTEPFSSAKLHYALGQSVARTAEHPEKSLLVAAAKHEVPVYTSSPGDSSIGMNLIVPQLFGKPVNLNPILDVIETAAIVRSADRNGVIEIGGGSPKNFYLQTQPTLHQILMDPSRGGHDYFIQLTTDSPHWGGLSGATPSEARSWGKLKDAHRNNVVVYSCASITFPLLAQYALLRNEPPRASATLPTTGRVGRRVAGVRQGESRVSPELPRALWLLRSPTMETRPNNFLGLEPRFSDYDQARFVILPIPYDATTSYRPGTRFGPSAIISASQQIELFDPELGGEFHKCGIATLDPLAPNATSPAAMHEDIRKYASRVVRDGKIPIGLGGEHSITGGLVRAAAGRHKKLSVLQLDAHSDLRDQYEGSPYSHASAMRRVLDHAERVVPVGIRSHTLAEQRFMRKEGISPISARDCHSTEGWLDRAMDLLTDRVYITIDIDAFDPAYAPGTGTPEPGGLDWYQVTDLLHLVAAEKTIVGADVVEVIPLPSQSTTEFLAAKLAYKLISLIQATDE